MADVFNSTSAVDRLESEFMSELENGRLVRLLCKFGFINERPEFARDPRWSETGDRYIVKLFRDYVFHQVDEVGRPVVSLSHVLTCLNKVRIAFCSVCSVKISSVPLVDVRLESPFI